MLRLAWIIIAVALIGAASVHLRLRQAEVRSDMLRLEGQRLKVRRTLWDQQLLVSELVAGQAALARGQAAVASGPAGASGPRHPGGGG